MIMIAAALFSMLVLYYIFDAEEKIEAARRRQEEYEKYLLELETKRKIR